MILSELIAGFAHRATPDLCLRLEQIPSVDPTTFEIHDLTDDSRNVRAGSLFIARSGTKSDGRRFIPDALAAGAVAILTDEEPGRLALPAGHRVPVLYSNDVALASAHLAEVFHGSPSAALDLIGITGTNGKTTTAHLVHQLLNMAGRRCGLIGTVQIDDGRSITPAVLTTPSATETSRTLARMLDAGCGAAVMEASSHALDQGRVAGLRYAAAIFTNLTGDHLDYHGTMERYAQAKARLFDALPRHSWAIVNADDPWSPRMIARHAAAGGSVLHCRVLEANGATRDAATPSDSEAFASIRSVSLRGSLVEFAGPWGRDSATIRLLGRHNVMNMLQALAAAWCVGVPPRELLRHAPRAIAPPGRLEPVTPPDSPFAVLVDYAHTDDALDKVMTTLRNVLSDASSGSRTRGRLLVVFGCGGDRDRTKRPRMGEVASRLADLAFVTSDNPRTEAPSAIIDEIIAGVPGDRRERVIVSADRRHAINEAIHAAHEGDIVLIAGKGHETYQIVPDGQGGSTTQHFDDREEARAALATLRAPALSASGGA
jgi:UDP-N-acetylmuramoyl-L-alanyl-D-glutamate--2,6-diaminopimelate ligase